MENLNREKAQGCISFVADNPNATFKGTYKIIVELMKWISEVEHCGLRISGLTASVNFTGYPNNADEHPLKYSSEISDGTNIVCNMTELESALGYTRIKDNPTRNLLLWLDKWRRCNGWQKNENFQPFVEELCKMFDAAYGAATRIRIVDGEDTPPDEIGQPREYDAYDVNEMFEKKEIPFKIRKLGRPGNWILEEHKR